jgi:hypothetical protein
MVGIVLILEQTFKRMCQFHNEEGNHIWPYYVRSLARPAWLARPGKSSRCSNRNSSVAGVSIYDGGAKVVISCDERRAWALGRKEVGNKSRSIGPWFVVRRIELYLRPGGRFGYVMPLSAQTRSQYAGFRSGRYPVRVGVIAVKFDLPCGESSRLSFLSPWVCFWAHVRKTATVQHRERCR